MRARSGPQILRTTGAAVVALMRFRNSSTVKGRRFLLSSETSERGSSGVGNDYLNITGGSLKIVNALNVTTSGANYGIVTMSGGTVDIGTTLRAYPNNP